MNTLTPFYLALADSLGEIQDRIDEMAEDAEDRLDVMVDDMTHRQSQRMATFLYGGWWPPGFACGCYLCRPFPLTTAQRWGIQFTLTSELEELLS